MRTLPATRVFAVCLSLLVTFRVTIIAADAEIAALTRAKALLASRDRLVAAVILVDKWPSGAPSLEAFATAGSIFVKSGGNILRAAVQWRRFDVVLASLLLHEQSHLLGATEAQALQIELDWLTSENAGRDMIEEIRLAIDREQLNRTSPP